MMHLSETVFRIILWSAVLSVSACSGSSSDASSAPDVRLQSCANIMPLGDSITLGVNGGYRNNLHTGLQRNNCGVSYVGTLSDPHTRVVDKDHEGHIGISISAMASHIGGWVAAAQPNMILL